ncbi:hypothetical protein EHS25_000895 [Saitozyma podzolica]|uniref:F-box domain-containing protein n=1 Tax=Saitozyma podzolica TaxID=1890683 RepID=A0A427YXJ5_9TREE|nr:hypothetical protein EHS25_000895 [Saitozyma podzolica]
MDHPDVLLNVLSLLDRTTLAACLLVSREFYNLAGPLLYRHLRVSFWLGPSPLNGVLEPSTQTGTPTSPGAPTRRKHTLLQYTTSLNLGNHHLHCKPYFDTPIHLPNLRVLRIGSNPYLLTLCAVRGPRCPLFVQLNPTKLVLSTYHPLFPNLPIGAGVILPPSIETVVLLEKPGTGITPLPDLGYSFLEPARCANLRRIEIVFLSTGPDVGFTYISPCTVLGTVCGFANPENAFWENLASICAEFDGEIRVINAGGFDRAWLGIEEGDVANTVEEKVGEMALRMLEDRGTPLEEIEARQRRVKFEGMREWLERDWAGVVEPNEVQGWL